MRKFLGGGAVCAALGFISGGAVAQSNPAAEALFDAGRAAMAKGDYETGCRKLRESNRMEAAVGTQFNLADCEEKRGKLATAWSLFQSVAQKVPEGDERGGIARDRANAVEKRLPMVTLRLEGASASDVTVRDGDMEYGSASFDMPLPVDPGPHDLVITSPGHAPKKIHVELREGEHRDVVLQLGDSESGPSAPSGSPAAPESGSQKSSGSVGRTLGFVIGGIGVAGLGVGAVAGVMVLGKKSSADDECPNKACSSAGLDAVDSGRSLKTVSNVGWVVGAVGLGVGAALILTSSGGSSTTAVGLAPTPTGAELSVRRTF